MSEESQKEYIYLDQEERAKFTLDKELQITTGSRPLLHFNHTFTEIWWSMFPNMPYPADYTLYNKRRRNDQVFAWCNCSDAYIYERKPSKSVFLTKLHQDIEKVACNAVIKKFCYFTLPKPIDEYKEAEDSYIKRLKEHLDIPISERDSVYSFILNKTDLEEEYYYLLMNYMDNAGYMEHGISIRCGYKSL